MLTTPTPDGGPERTTADAVAEAARSVVDVTPDLPPSEARAALRAFDAAWRALEDPEDPEALVVADEVLATLQAFPEAWRPLAREATTRLGAADAPPFRGPLWEIWAAIEASELEWAPSATARVPFVVQRAAGHTPTLEVRSAARGRLAAPPWERLADRPTLVATEDGDGPILLVLEARPPVITCDGLPSVLVPHPEGWYTRLTPGTWEVRGVESSDACRLGFQVRSS